MRRLGAPTRRRFEWASSWGHGRIGWASVSRVRRRRRESSADGRGGLVEGGRVHLPRTAFEARSSKLEARSSELGARRWNGLTRTQYAAYRPSRGQVLTPLRSPTPSRAGNTGGDAAAVRCVPLGYFRVFTFPVLNFVCCGESFWFLKNTRCFFSL